MRNEVKSVAYLQSWKQNQLSSINFEVRATLGWDAVTNTPVTDQRRQANVYVFCLLHQEDKATIDPLDMSQWTFYVVAKRTLNDRLPLLKSISLATLLRLNPRTCGFNELSDAIYLEAGFAPRER